MKRLMIRTVFFGLLVCVLSLYLVVEFCCLQYIRTVRRDLRSLPPPSIDGRIDRGGFIGTFGEIEAGVVEYVADRGRNDPAPLRTYVRHSRCLCGRERFGVP